MKNKNILFLMSGSIAAYKACDLISKLVKAEAKVQTVVTPGLLHFVGAATLEGLTGQAVLSDVYESGRAMDHINLARNADLILLCPATANTINKLAAGIADDAIGALFLANNFKKPFWIVPAMNTEMYNHPATQAALQKLSSWGTKVFGTAEGRLACGEEGVGKMLEPADLFSDIERFLK